MKTYNLRISLMAAIFLLMGLQSGLAQDAAVPWTLDRCLDAALTNSPQLEAGARRAAAAQADAAEASAARFGSLGATGAFSYVSETMSLNLKLPIPGLTLPQIHFGDGRNYDLALVAQAPIYTGGALTERLRAARSGSESVELDQASDSAAIRYQLRRAFYVALAAQVKVETAAAGVERMQRHLSELERARQAGAASVEALITLQTGLRQAESALIAAKSEARAARLSLGNLVGCSGAEVQPDGDLEQSALTYEPDVSAWQDRPELKAFDARIAQAQHLSAVIRGSYYPTLSALAAYHYARPGINTVANEWMDYAVAGVNLTWTLWDFRSRQLRVEKSTAAARALEANRRQVQDALHTQSAATRSQLESAAEALGKARERVELQRQRLDLIEGRYRQGMATESELLDGEDDLRNTELDLARAQAAQRMAEVDLLYASGR